MDAPGGIEGQVYHINEDRAGQVWVATDYGLVKLDPVTGTTIRYEHRQPDGTTLSSNFVRFTLETRDGSFWIATTSGLDVCDRQAGRVIRRVPLDVGVQNALMTLLEDHRGALWVSYSSGNGLANIDRATYGVTYYSTHEREPDPSQLSGVEDILEDRDGALWFVTRGNGLLRLDKNRKQLIRYRKRPDDSTSLSEDYIYCLFADRDGGIWAGTSGGGVNRFSISPMPFRAYHHNISNPQSLADDEVLSVLQDRRGVLWVGTKGVLNRIVRRARGKPDHYTFYKASDPRLGLASTVVVSMAEDRSGYVWFGTFGGGLNRFDPKTGRFKVYRHDPSDARSLADDVVSALYVSRNGAVWAASDSAISRFDPESDRFDVYRIPAEPVSQYSRDWRRRGRKVVAGHLEGRVAAFRSDNG
jgi:ligand-binding sensor domain-containing protein